MADELRRVTEHLGILDATEEVYEQTTGKGFDYEDLVDECVGTLAANYGDLAEVTAKQSGSSASHVGDEVVTLNRDDTHGVEARFTLEMKNRPLNMRKTMAELDEALCNRDALAAIAVFRSQEQAPTSVPFQHHDDKAIVVLRPRRRRRLRAASRLHVGALDRAQGARGQRGGRRRPRARRAACSTTRRARWSGTPRSSGSTPRPARTSTRPPTRCATSSTRCTRASNPSTPSSAPDRAIPCTDARTGAGCGVRWPRADDAVVATSSATTSRSR